MSTVYKKLTAQDVAVVPFNAHKQYNFDSGSASSNSVNVFQSRWTSESIDLYSSASTSYGLPADTINAVKYRQLDHLFYKNFKRDINNRFGNNHYLNQKRELHKEANILSIPTGLYGFEIKPGTFFLSSSIYEVIDDNNGNLIIKGTNLNDYETDIRSNVLNIGPVKGFEKYDLNTLDNYITFNGYERSVFYRDGKPRVNKISSYNTPKLGDEFDDSYYFNVVKYRNVNFSERILYKHEFPVIDFDGRKSEVRLGHNEKYNFNKGDDFTINFWTNANWFGEGGIGKMKISTDNPIFKVGHVENESCYLISKSTTETIIPNETTPIGTPVNTTKSGSFQTKDVPSSPQFPFEIFVKDNATNTPQLFFRRSDGDIITTVSSPFTTSSMQQVTCRVLSSEMKIYINGIASGTTAIDRSVNQTQNQANLYIGNRGGNTSFLTGSLSQINIFNKGLTDTQILNHYSSSNGSPYVGNIFYQNGLAAITHPQYQVILGGIGDFIVGENFEVGDNSIKQLKFQGSHLIYENEYQCTIDEYEFNSTTNISARKYKTSKTEDLANFATGSLFKPYITTVGLYNESNELLVVGKLGQPIKTSSETDTTLVLRWDT